MEAVPVQLEAATPKTTGLPPFCAKANEGGFAQALKSAMGKAVGIANPDAASAFPQAIEQSGVLDPNKMVIPNLTPPIVTELPQVPPADSGPEGVSPRLVPSAGSDVSTNKSTPKASWSTPTTAAPPIQISAGQIPPAAPPVPTSPQQVTPLPTPTVQVAEVNTAEANLKLRKQISPPIAPEEPVKPETKPEPVSAGEAVRAANRRPAKTRGQDVPQAEVTTPPPIAQPAPGSIVAPSVDVGHPTPPADAQIPDLPTMNPPTVPVIPAVFPDSQPTIPALAQNQQPAVAVSEPSLHQANQAVATPVTLPEAAAEAVRASDAPRPKQPAAASPREPLQPKPEPKPETVLAPDAAKAVALARPNSPPLTSPSNVLPPDVNLRVEAPKVAEPVRKPESKPEPAGERRETRPETTDAPVQATTPIHAAVTDASSTPPPPVSHPQTPATTQITPVPPDARHATSEPLTPIPRSDRLATPELHHNLELPTAPVQAARVIDRLGQTELHLGMRTEAFGSVQVHTVIRDSQVGLAVGGERGDLKSFLTPEVPGLENNFRQHDLRFNGIQFLGGNLAGGGGQPGNSGGYMQQFQPARSLHHSAALREAEIQEGVQAHAESATGLSVHA